MNTTTTGTDGKQSNYVPSYAPYPYYVPYRYCPCCGRKYDDYYDRPQYPHYLNAATQTQKNS